jgi:hypothetical protein
MKGCDAGRPSSRWRWSRASLYLGHEMLWGRYGLPREATPEPPTRPKLLPAAV